MKKVLLRILFLTFLLWILSSIVVVSEEENAVVLRLGKYHATLEPGIYWQPHFIDRVLHVDMQNQNTLSYPVELITKDENLVVINTIVEYQVIDAKEFLFNAQKPEEQLKLVVASAARQAISSANLEDVLSDNAEKQAVLNGMVREKIIAKLAVIKLGVKIISISVEPIHANSTLADTVDQLLRARADGAGQVEMAEASGKAAIAEAKEKQVSLIAAANTFKQQVVLDAKKSTGEYLALLLRYQKAPQLTKEELARDALNFITSKNKVILLGDKNKASVNLSVNCAEKTSVNASVLPDTADRGARPLRNDAPSRASYKDGEIAHAIP